MTSHACTLPSSCRLAFLKINNDENVEVSFTHPKAEGKLVFKKDGVWQLDNIIITKLDGRTFYTDFATVAEPLQAYVKAMEDKSPGQIMADDRYLTDKGKKVRLRLLELNKEHSGGDTSGTFDEPVVNGDIANFSMHAFTPDGEMEGCYQIVRTFGGWKFDDLVMVKVNGRTVNVVVSDQIDNPLGVWFRSLFW